MLEDVYSKVGADISTVIRTRINEDSTCLIYQLLNAILKHCLGFAGIGQHMLVSCTFEWFYDMHLNTMGIQNTTIIIHAARSLSCAKLFADDQADKSDHKLEKFLRAANFGKFGSTGMGGGF